MSCIKLLWVLEYKSLYVHIMWLLLINKHAGMTLFSYTVSLYLDTTNMFSKELYYFTFSPAMYGGSRLIFLPVLGILETNLNCSQRQTTFFKLPRWLSEGDNNDIGFVIYEHNSFSLKCEYWSRHTMELTNCSKCSKKTVWG